MNEEQVTGSPTVEQDFTAENQEGSKGFSQEDIDRIVKERLSRERAKIMKQYEGVDVDRYRQMLEAQEAKEQEEQVKRGEFEKILQTTVSKKDQAIQQLQNELKAIKVDGNLLGAASSKKAINPQQVARLLKDQIRLSTTGEVEVLDDNGSVRYNDQGTVMSVEELVGEFLNNNPHFVTAGPQGTGSTSSVAKANGNLGVPDPGKLNMNDPNDRRVFKEMMKSKGIRI
jgi:hypothetical protein